MFSLRSRAVRFRQLWMETRLELIYNVVVATRSAPNTPKKPVDTHGNRVVERISVDEALSDPLAGDLVGQTPRCRTCPLLVSYRPLAAKYNSNNILASDATATRGQPARIDIPSMRHRHES
jgi:hypothetical protein